jgi:O-antigen ligase
MIAGLAGLATYDPHLVFRVGPFIAAAVFLTGRPMNLRMSATVFLSLTYLAWIAASSTWAVSPIAQQTVVIWAALLIMFIATLDLIKSVPQLRAVSIGYLTGAFLAVARLVFSNFDSITVGSSQRLTTDGINENYLGYAFVTGMALLPLLWYTKERTLRIRVGLIGTGIAMIIGMNLTGSRGALISVVAFVVWLLACRASKRPPIRLLVAAIFAVAVIIATGVLDTASGAVDFGSRATGDLSGRIPLWEAARTIWSEHPWIGSGMWASRTLNISQIDAHNVILEVGSSLGIVGVAIFLALIWSTLRVRPNSGPVVRIVVGAFLAVAATPYLSGAWEPSPASWILLAIIARVAVLDGDPPPSALALRVRADGWINTTLRERPRLDAIPELNVRTGRGQDRRARVRRTGP